MLNKRGPLQTTQRCQKPLKIPDLGISTWDLPRPLLPCFQAQMAGWASLRSWAPPSSHCLPHTWLTFPPSHLHSKDFHECGSEEVKLLQILLQLQLELGTYTSALVWPPCGKQWVCDNHICKVSCPGSFVVSSHEFKGTIMGKECETCQFSETKIMAQSHKNPHVYVYIHFYWPHMFYTSKCISKCLVS